jgi:hypothetical protein
VGHQHSQMSFQGLNMVSPEFAEALVTSMLGCSSSHLEKKCLCAFAQYVAVRLLNTV